MSDVTPNHSLYEKFTGFYEFFFKPFFIRGIKKTIKFLEDHSLYDVLEVGVGTGYSLEYYPPGYNIVAYDVSNKMVEEARKKSQQMVEKDITILDPDFYESYLKSKTFSAVITFSVMSVVPDPQVFLEQLRKNCKRGGYILIIMHSRNTGVKKVFDYLFELPCRFLFGFSLLRHVEDLDTTGLKLVKHERLAGTPLYNLNNLIVYQKEY